MTAKRGNQAPRPTAQPPSAERRNAISGLEPRRSESHHEDCQTLLAATKSYEKAIRLVQAGHAAEPNIFLEDNLDRTSDGMGSLLVYLNQVLTDLKEVGRRTLSLIDQIQDRT